MHAGEGVFANGSGHNSRYERLSRRALRVVLGIEEVWK